MQTRSVSWGDLGYHGDSLGSRDIAGEVLLLKLTAACQSEREREINSLYPVIIHTKSLSCLPVPK